MSINIPDSSSVVKNRVKASIQTRLSLANPFKKDSWFGAFADSFSERIYDFYYAIVGAIDEVMPDTTLDNLERWGSFYNLQPTAASISVGKIVFKSGNTASDVIVPTGWIFTDASGNKYETTADSEALGDVVTLGITRSGTTATATSPVLHFLKSGDSIVISGATQTQYNGTVTITATSGYAFTYQVSGSPATPATGTPVFTRSRNSVAARSLDFGLDKNLAPYTVLSMESPLTNILDDAFVDFEGFTGGQDREGTEAFRARLLDRMRNPIAHFNESEIKDAAKTIAGVTRVFVNVATPAAGQVTIYFTTDNDVSPIPNAGTVALVQTKIQSITPANTSYSDIIVAAPTALPVAFTFTALSPNTQSMRDSIIETLKQFFAETVDVGEDITQDDYRAVIKTTIDLTTGAEVVSFALSTPSGTITTSASQLATLGTVTWP